MPLDLSIKSTNVSGSISTTRVRLKKKYSLNRQQLLSITVTQLNCVVYCNRNFVVYTEGWKLQIISGNIVTPPKILPTESNVKTAIMHIGTSSKLSAWTFNAIFVHNGFIWNLFSFSRNNFCRLKGHGFNLSRILKIHSTLFCHDTLREGLNVSFVVKTR